MGGESLLLLLIAAATAAAVGSGLHWLARRNQQSATAQTRLIEQINRQLPQLQCGECGYPGCRPYAEAIASQAVGIELCPPGGNDTVQRLAELLNTDAPPLLPPPQPLVAHINADDCVGCALCLPVCPTDAIIGAARHAHVVDAARCVGCRLCLPPCPVDCIDMVAVGGEVPLVHAAAD